jgi:hypothetical protein
MGVRSCQACRQFLQSTRILCNFQWSGSICSAQIKIIDINPTQRCVNIMSLPSVDPWRGLQIWHKSRILVVSVKVFSTINLVDTKSWVAR